MLELQHCIVQHAVGGLHKQRRLDAVMAERQPLYDPVCKCRMVR